MMTVMFPSILFLIAIGPIPSILYFDRRFSEIKYDPWKNFTDDAGPWCERHHEFGLVKEKSNAYSDYIFVLSAVYFLARTRYEKKRRESDNLLKLIPNLGYLYAAINMFHAIGTFINHSCRCSFGHQLDLIGMYSITNYWMPYYILRYAYYNKKNVYRSYNKPKIISSLYKRYFILYIGFSIITYPFTSIPYSNSHSEHIEFTILTTSCGLCLLLDFMTHRLCKKKQITLYYVAKGKCLHIGIVVILLGAIMQKMDASGIMCDPIHIIQFHSLWHIAAAIATIMAYEHANSEFPYYMNLPFIKTFPTVRSP